MKEISKSLAHKLNKEYGIPFKDGGISHSYTRNGRHYYLCESYANMQKLREATGQPRLDNKNRNYNGNKKTR